METQSQPPDLSLQLPRDVYHVVVYTLRGLLPPPEADTPEAEARRDRAAIARVASMLPANDEEADLVPPAASVSPPTAWTACAWLANIAAATIRSS